MFSLGKTGNVGLPWGSAGTGRGLKEWGWGGGEGRGQRPRGLVGLWVPKHLSDIGFCEQMSCLKQLSPLCPFIMQGPANALHIGHQQAEERFWDKTGRGQDRPTLP